MANLYGFVRLPGPSQNYRNVSNPDLPIGTQLSKRQYEKFIRTLGHESKSLRSGFEALAEANKKLEKLNAELERQLAEIFEREQSLDERERAFREREALLIAEQARIARADAQGRGNRRYRSALNLYVEEQRRRGNNINKRQAQQSPEFKQIIKDLKGIPNPHNDPDIAAKNEQLRFRALFSLGGWKAFREEYERLYPNAPHRARGVNARGRSTGARRRAA